MEYSHHEVGPVAARDRHALRRRAADGRQRHDLPHDREGGRPHSTACYATFMPKPLFGENGSGMHVHQSLFRGEQNAFFDAGRRVLPVGRRPRASSPGSSRHTREIACVFAQWVNSYKRLVPGYEAPVYIAWSRRNRSALDPRAAVPPGQGAARRAPSCAARTPPATPTSPSPPCCTPGSRGSRRATSCRPRWRQNLYDLTHEERQRAGIESLPESLGRGDRARRGQRAAAEVLRRAHPRALRGAEARGMGGLPGAGHPLRAGAVPAAPVSGSSRGSRAAPLTGGAGPGSLDRPGDPA